MKHKFFKILSIGLFCLLFYTIVSINIAQKKVTVLNSIPITNHINIEEIDPPYI